MAKKSPLSLEHQDAIDIIVNSFFVSNDLGGFESSIEDDPDKPDWFFHFSYCPEYPLIEVNSEGKEKHWSSPFLSLDLRVDNEGLIHDISFKSFIGNYEEESDFYTFIKSFSIQKSVMEVAEAESPFSEELAQYKKEVLLFIETFCR
tara:strand:+ start:1130 stop:1570 length:441 start_codon:yes stop_codon:yes gene_type:complete